MPLPLYIFTLAAAGDSAMFGYLLDVVILLAAAMFLGAMFERLRQSAIVGYLLAGTLLGPNAFDLVVHDEGVAAIAELGVALLLFSIGLEFSWGRLRSLGRPALLGGVMQLVFTLIVGTGAALLLGEGAAAAVAVGAVVALSSTAVVLRTLADRAELDAVHGRAALGILLVQDIAVVPLVLLIETLGGQGSAGEVAWRVMTEVAMGAAMVGVFVLLARYGLPRVVAHPSISKNRELPILFAIVAAAGSAWSAYAIGLSPALGAFVAGVILAGSPLATQVRADVGPLKTVFVTLFFSAIGMLADVEWLVTGWHLPLVLGVLLGVVAGKAAVIWGVERLLRMPHRHAVATGLSLAQVGEFSFVLATMAAGVGVFSEDTFALLVSVTIGSLFVTPYLIGGALPVGGWVERRLRGKNRNGTEPLRRPRSAQGNADEAQEAEEEPTNAEHTPLRGHVVIIGFGPAGRAVAEGLARGGTPVMIIDLNPRTVLAARNEGLHALAGDAASAEVIEHAHAPMAKAVVVTVPDHRAAVATIERVRAECPNVPIIARARYHVHAGALRMAGAHVAVDEEDTVGRRLSEEVGRVL